MSIANLGAQQINQTTKATKQEQSHQNVLQSQMQQLFQTHNHMMTRILQNGLNIPKELVEKIKQRAPLLKKIYFGLDNFIIDSSLMPQDQKKHLVLYTATLPIVLPIVFLDEEVPQDALLTQQVKVNLLDEKKWFDSDLETVETPEFLKVGLALFSSQNIVKKEQIKAVQVAENPFIPEHSVVFSLKCNLYTLLLFFYNNRQYFSSMHTGINAYLKFLRLN